MDPNLMPPPPMIVITEQPQQRGMRFRYECEGRSAGSIPGENTNQDRKTWPSIQIANYTGEVTIRVSLVSKDNPPRPHPHSLVGKDCVNGICTVRVSPETQMTATFSNLGIQCVKRKEVAESLRLRKKLQVDPFNTFSSSDPQAVDIDLNIVQLCFEAFITQNNKHMSLQPAVSNPVFDKKATSSAVLRICRVNRSFGSCKGGDEVFLLCDKVQKDDITICFFELGTGWESYGEFAPTDVHRQVAIVFRTPPYKDQHIVQPTKVLFRLKRSSDGQTSDSKDFTYLPLHHAPPRLRGIIDRKRKPDDINHTTQRALREHINGRVREVPGNESKMSRWGPQQQPSSSQQQNDVLERFLNRCQLPQMPFSPATSPFRPMGSPRFQPQQNWMHQPSPSMIPSPSYASPNSNTLSNFSHALPTPMHLGPTSPPDSQNANMLPDHDSAPFDFNAINIEPLLSTDINVEEEMQHLSIEENISFSDIMKQEPPPTTIPFPNPIHPPSYPSPAPTTFNIQAASPQQQFPINEEFDRARAPNVHLLSTAYDLEPSIPSFDLNEPQQFPSDTTQNDIEDIVKGATAE